MSGNAVNKLLKEIKKYVKQNSALLVACSGGADSAALTDALWQLKNECCYKITVMHVEHGIRGQEALDDAEFVKNFCAERGLAFVCRHVKAPDYALQNGLSLEDAARRLRYKALFAYAAEAGCDYIVTAHQADDQAETVLMQLLRGSGTSGLGGMQTASGKLLRPFLFVRRTEIEAYCHERGLRFCNDSTNDDVRYTRNRIRKELLPYLEKSFNPRVIAALGNTAQLARADNDFAAYHAQVFYNQNVKANGKLLECQAEALKTEFAAVSRRVVRMMWEKMAACGSELGFEHVEAVLGLLKNSSSGKMLALPGKTAAAYFYGMLYVGAQPEVKKLISASAEFDEITVLIESTGKLKKLNLPDGGVLQFSTAEECPELTKKQAAVPLAIAGNELCIRTRRDGDRFYPYGSAGSKKLKDYFIDNKVPRAERDKKLLVTAGSKVLWIIGERQAGWKTRPDGKWLVMRLAGRKDEKMNENIAKVLLSEEEIQKRVKELGRQIHDDYKYKDKIVMIGLLKGAIYFFTDLSLAIDLPLRIDFMVASSYGSGTETSGNVDIRLSCSENIEGCHVLLVDDIIDSGVTMEAITRLLMAQKPASVKKVALCDKPSRRVNKLNADYVGFEIPDEFVVGYGLDYAGDYRNLPFIGVLKPEAYAK